MADVFYLSKQLTLHSHFTLHQFLLSHPNRTDDIVVATFDNYVLVRLTNALVHVN